MIMRSVILGFHTLFWCGCSTRPAQDSTAPRANENGPATSAPALKDPAFKLAPLGEVKVNGKDAVGVSVSHKGHKDVSVFFDKETGLPVKSEARIADPNGKEITIEYVYSDFRDAEGVKHPMKIGIKGDGKEFTVELSEIKAKEKLDDNEFAKP